MLIVHRVNIAVKTAFFCLFLMIAGCAGSKEAGGKKDKEPFIIEPAKEKNSELELAEVHPEVGTIQLYQTLQGAASDYDTPTGAEARFPMLAMGSNEALQLEFDLIGDNSRPLSVYFYHADADWQRDLLPAEYLTLFHRDNILDFKTSRSTDVSYSHYTYQFPNESISFTLSGNYILRVTEMGQENNVLFERPFWVSEQNTNLQVGIENLLIGQGGFTAVQPVVSFIPPSSLGANIFDFSACFVRNGRFEKPRCIDRPSLIQEPAVRFYLEPNQAFQPVTADYFVDLGQMRVGNKIAKIDFGRSPYTVILEPDYARFPGDPLSPVLNGQTIVNQAVIDYDDADVSAQYVDALFGYVTESSGKITGDIYVVGSFSEWRVREDNRMEWNEELERYEATLRLKQGQYEYRFVSGKERLPRGTASRPENLYTALVYYNDIRVNTDRLLSFGSFIGR